MFSLKARKALLRQAWHPRACPTLSQKYFSEQSHIQSASPVFEAQPCQVRQVRALGGRCTVHSHRLPPDLAPMSVHTIPHRPCQAWLLYILPPSNGSRQATSMCLRLFRSMRSNPFPALNLNLPERLAVFSILFSGFVL